MEDIRIDVQDKTCWIRLNRPQARNALRHQTFHELTAAIEQANANPTVRAVILTGEDPAFSAGGDVKEMATRLQTEKPDVHSARRLVRGFHTMIRALYELEKPVICAVNGPAFGAGANLTLVCDLRIASENATFCWAFVHRGLAPDAGSTFLLQQTLGYTKAFELLALGPTISAHEALRLGLLTAITPHPKLEETATEWAARLTSGPPNAISLIKRALQFAAHAPFPESLENEANLQALAFGGPEFTEGVASFLEKRPPKF